MRAGARPTRLNLVLDPVQDLSLIHIYSIQLGDTVIAVTSGERTIGELNDIYH